ncbi:MAG: hypothetical protein ABIS14_09115 [Sphingomonas sp.]
MTTTNPFARTFAATAALVISAVLVLTAVGPVHVAPVQQSPLAQFA